MTNALDFNTAEVQATTIPDGSIVPVRFTYVYGDHGGPQGNALHKSKTSEALMLKLEATVTEGPFAKRKFWPNYFMGTISGELSGGHETAVGISRKMLRAIVEAARGFSPTDETPAAVKARQLDSLDELDGMECWVVTGIEKGTGGFDDKTVIKRVIPAGKEPGEKAFDAKAEAASMRTAKPTAQKGW